MNNHSLNATDDLKELYQFRLTVGTVGAIISSLGYGLMWLTAALFPVWRRTRQNQLWLHMCGSYLAFFCSDFYTFVYPIEDPLTDDIVEYVNKYLVRVSLCWMLAGAFLTYKNLVDVFGDIGDRFMLKASLCAWLSPLLVVILMYIIYYFQLTEVCYSTGTNVRLGCNLFAERKLRNAYWFINCFLDNSLVTLPILGSLGYYCLVAISLSRSRKVAGHERDLGSTVALGFFFVFTCCLQCTIITSKFVFSLGGIWNYVTIVLMSFHVSTYTTLFIVCNKMTRDMWSRFLRTKLLDRRCSWNETLKV